MQTKPYQHQKDVHEKSKNKLVFAYFLEQGTGKSLCALMDFEHLYERGEIDAVLIVAPNNVHRNWAYNEIPTHWDKDQATFVWDSNKAGTLKYERSFHRFTESDGMKFLCINVDAVNTKHGFAYAKWFLENLNAAMIVDESTKIANPKAQRTKAVVQLGHLATYKRIASGTPVASSPLGLYSQMGFLDKGIINSRNYKTFCYRYGEWRKRPNPAGGRDFEELVRYKNLEELKEKIDPYSFRLLKTECLDLPEKIFEYRYFDLTRKQRSLYEELKEDAIAEIGDDQYVSAPIALTKLLRLQQLTSNFVVDEDEKVTTVDDKNPRLKALQEELEDSSEQAIIWCRFKHDINAVMDTLSSAVRYDGEIDSDSRSEAIDRFQSGQAQYFVATPQAAGQGLTLTAASKVIWYSHVFSLEDYLQANDRPHRIGQRNNVTYVHLIADNSIDDKIVQALVDKKNISDIVTGDNVRNLV